MVGGWGIVEDLVGNGWRIDRWGIVGGGWLMVKVCT